MTLPIEKNILITLVGGSQSYGLATEHSDHDLRSVFHADLKDLLGLESCPDTYELKEAEGNTRIIHGKEERCDEVFYELKKFFLLLMTTNPNIIEMLFVNDEHILKMDERVEIIFESRNIFLSKKARYSFAGYATSQLGRIKTHRSWLISPPKKSPERSDYGLPAMPQYSKDQFSAFKKLVSYTLESKREYFDTHLEFQKLYDKIDWDQCVNEYDEEQWKLTQTMMNADSNFMDILKREFSYKNAVTYYNQYLNWQKNRNPSRSKLEEKFGYDTKHATHLVRLLTQAKEILSTGTLHTCRTGIDADFLMDIRNGKYKYEEILEFSESLNREMDEIYKTCDVLPVEPDKIKIKELYNLLLNRFYDVM